MRLTNRRDFATDRGWREIRGVRVSEQRVASSDGSGIEFEERNSWYFDRLGKTERYQRHAYAFTAQPFDGGEAARGAGEGRATKATASASDCVSTSAAVSRPSK